MGYDQSYGTAVKPSKQRERQTLQTLDRRKEDPGVRTVPGRGRHMQGSTLSEIEQTAFCLVHATVELP